MLAYAAGIYLFRGALLDTAPGLPFSLPRSGALVEGRVAEYPAVVPGGTRFVLEADTFYGKPFKARLMVYARAAKGATYGDRVSFIADLEIPPGASVPGSLDWADYLARRGIAAQARAFDLDITGKPGRFILLARRFRGAALSAFGRALPPAEASVLGGVVIGEKRSVPPGLKTAFQDSGAMHLLVASGSNVGFVVAVVYFLCSRLRLRREYAGLAALGLAGFYVVAAGLDAPLVRAYLMFSAGLCAWLLRREAGGFHALTAACLLILVVSPRSLFDASFQMSFLAAYGLCAGMGAWGKYAPKSGVKGALCGLLLVSLFAQLGLYPLLAIYFHKISLISPVSNMVLVPASGVAMGLGFLLAFFSGAGFVFGPLAYVCGIFMELFLGTVRFFAGVPFSSVYVAEPSGWFTAGFFLLALAVLHAPLLGFAKPRLYLLLAGALTVMSGGLAARGGAGPYRAVLFGDGNTACAFVYAGSEEPDIVNPGLNGRKLADAVLAGGARRARWVLLTSLEEKNFSGLEALAKVVGLRGVLLPYGRQPEGLRRVLQKLRGEGVRVSRVWPGPAAAGEPGAFWEAPAGYTGGPDVVGWRIGPFRVGGEGTYAEAAGAAAGETADRMAAQPWKTMVLELKREDRAAGAAGETGRRSPQLPGPAGQGPAAGTHAPHKLL
ncbi:MAG: hypothetical protein A2016_11050 [Elusimicrobia bacterium GWF2_62_30]|nr:MAG: hypothetical protein A2016_11050 [Elusimicrobia bacterium GWF2_62_30]